MNILANENFPEDAILILRQHGHNVVWIRTEAPGSSDEQVLARAQAEDRILITFDKDFGELAFRARLPASSGIILFRISIPSSAHVGRVAAAVLDSRSDWAGHFAVIEDNRIRMTPLPQK
jgi:predicted nuclease of predicted toxin-antitoxin system